MIRKVSLLVLGVLLCLVSAAKADITIKFESNVQIMQMMKIETVTTIRLSEDNIREDITMKIHNLQLPDMSSTPQVEIASIMKMNEKKAYLLIPKQKIFSKMDIDSLWNLQLNNSSNLPENMKEYLGSSEDYEWEMNIETSDDITEINGHKCIYKNGYLTGTRKSNPSKKIHFDFEIYGEKETELVNEVKTINKKYEKIPGLNQTDILNNLSTKFPMFLDKFVEFGIKINSGNMLGIKMNAKIQYTGDLLSPKYLIGLNPEDSTDQETQMFLDEMFGKIVKDENGMATFSNLSYVVTETNTSRIDDIIFDIPDDYTEEEMDFNNLIK